MKNQYVSSNGKYACTSTLACLEKDLHKEVYSEITTVETLVKIKATTAPDLPDGVRIDLCRVPADGQDMYVYSIQPSDYAVLTERRVQDILKRAGALYAVIPVAARNCSSSVTNWLHELAYDSVKASLFGKTGGALDEYAEPIIRKDHTHSENITDTSLEYVVFNKSSVCRCTYDRMYIAILLLVHRQLQFIADRVLNTNDTSLAMRHIVALMQLLSPETPQEELKDIPSLDLSDDKEEPTKDQMSTVELMLCAMKKFLSILAEEQRNNLTACPDADSRYPLCVIMYKAFTALCEYFNDKIKDFNEKLNQCIGGNDKDVLSALYFADELERLLVPYIRLPK